MANQEQSSKNPRGFFIINFLFILLGIFTIFSKAFVSHTPAYFFGFIFFAVGFLQIMQSFSKRGVGDFFVFLFSGIVAIVVGLLLIARPGQSFETIALLLAVFFFASGLFQAFYALFVGPENWLLLIISGVINVAVGLSIYNNWLSSTYPTTQWLVGAGLVANGVVSTIGVSIKPKPPAQVQKQRKFESIRYNEKD